MLSGDRRSPDSFGTRSRHGRRRIDYGRTSRPPLHFFTLHLSISSLFNIIFFFSFQFHLSSISSFFNSIFSFFNIIFLFFLQYHLSYLSSISSFFFFLLFPLSYLSFFNIIFFILYLFFSFSLPYLSVRAARLCSFSLHWVHCGRPRTCHSVAVAPPGSFSIASHYVVHKSCLKRKFKIVSSNLP